MPFSGLRVVNCENAFYLWFGNLCFALIWPSLLDGRCLSWSSDINFWTAKVQSFRLELRITLSMHAVQCTPQSCYLSPLELRCDKKTIRFSSYPTHIDFEFNPTDSTALGVMKNSSRHTAENATTAFESKGPHFTDSQNVTSVQLLC